MVISINPFTVWFIAAYAKNSTMTHFSNLSLFKKISGAAKRFQITVFLKLC